MPIQKRILHRISALRAGESGLFNLIEGLRPAKDADTSHTKVVADIIREFGGRMASILTSYENAPEGQRLVFIRIYGVARKKSPGLAEKLRSQSRLLYMVDHAANHREIFDLLHTQ